jgi:hypothetical protein
MGRVTIPQEGGIARAKHALGRGPWLGPVNAHGTRKKHFRCRRLPRGGEPPGADPHARWCGGRELETPAHPIGPCFNSLSAGHANRMAASSGTPQPEA